MVYTYLVCFRIQSAIVIVICVRVYVLWYRRHVVNHTRCRESVSRFGVTCVICGHQNVGVNSPLAFIILTAVPIMVSVSARLALVLVVDFLCFCWLTPPAES